MARIQISNDSSGRIIVSFPYDPVRRNFRPIEQREKPNEKGKNDI
jgi:hypothetical protein